MNKIKARFQSKTYWAAIAMATLSIVEVNSQLISQAIPQEYRTYLIMAWPLVMITLREITNGALDNK